MALLTFKQLAKELEQRSKSLEKQVKFAAANALNDCAAQAAKDISKAYEKEFEVRNKSFGKALWWTRAKPNILMNTISYKNDFMVLHTTGGTRKPTDGRSALSVPVYENDRRMENGRTRKRDKAPALLKYADEHNGKKLKAKSAVKRPFLLKVGGNAYIVKRAKGNTTKESRHRGNGDLFLFSMKKDAKIEKRWDFDKIVKDSVDEHLDEFYRKRLKWALENAKQ